MMLMVSPEVVHGKVRRVAKEVKKASESEVVVEDTAAETNATVEDTKGGEMVEEVAKQNSLSLIRRMRAPRSQLRQSPQVDRHARTGF